MTTSDYIALGALIVSIVALISGVAALIWTKKQGDRLYGLEKQKYDMDKSGREKAELLESEKTAVKVKLLCSELKRLIDKLSQIHETTWGSLTLHITGIDYNLIKTSLAEVAPIYIPIEKSDQLTKITAGIKEIADRQGTWDVHQGKKDHRDLLDLANAIEQILSLLEPSA